MDVDVEVGLRDEKVVVTLDWPAVDRVRVAEEEEGRMLSRP